MSFFICESETEWYGLKLIYYEGEVEKLPYEKLPDKTGSPPDIIQHNKLTRSDVRYFN